MKIYQAIYFNGVTSIPYEVELEIFPDYLLLTYYSNEEEHVIEWKIDKIKENSFFSLEAVTLKYGEFPQQILEVKDLQLIQQLHKLPVFKASKRKFGLFASGSKKNLFLAAISLIGVSFLLYFYVIPFIGEKAAYLVSQETEITMGNKIYENIVESYEIDEQKTELLNQFVQEINFNSNYPIRVTVVESDVQNAFALPGGQIVIFSEIINKMESPEQLAALLSHEVSHVVLRHTTKNICRSAATGLVLSVLINDINGISGVLIQNAENLKSLSYSRKLEEEADNNGLQILMQNKINPQGMIKLMDQLEKASDGIEVPEFISTHPITESRKKYIKENIDKGFHPKGIPVKLDFIWRKIKATVKK